MKRNNECMQKLQVANHNLLHQLVVEYMCSSKTTFYIYTPYYYLLKKKNPKKKMKETYLIFQLFPSVLFFFFFFLKEILQFYSKQLYNNRLTVLVFTSVTN